MIVRILLSVGLLACLVAADTESSHGHNYTRFLIQLHEYGNGTKKSEVYTYKDGHVRNILDNGVFITAFYESKVTAFIGARDGIYFYDDETEKLEKYGTVNDSVIGVVKENNTGDLYIVTEDHVVYKVTEGGTKKAEIEQARGAQRIEVDWDGNLYFIGADNQAYVIAVDGVKKIQGLPPYQTDAVLYKAPPTVEHGVNLMWNNSFYYIFSDGTSTQRELSAEEKALFDESEKVSREIMEILDKENN